ncbi:acyloxyacyl hydrolase [Flavobacterium rhizosphaerae]|uniref:Acyloxyacyl hydrolase n=1 Tax=Flavobacterium rhizosphaerae TaxID=3163298 RepID=A0ABW8YST0_9FLAO
MRRILLFLLTIPLYVSAQQDAETGCTVDAGYFYGNIIPHRKSIKHLIIGHPTGMLISLNRKTFGKYEWEQAYNYPDYGVSLHYEDMKNEALGEMYGLYGHYNFYFINRSVMLRIGQGVAYNTNPYDKDTNFRNYAYGAHLMPSTYFMLNYTRQHIFAGFGLQAGLLFVHHSNASMKSPNTSTNTFAVNVGLNYSFDKNADNVYQVSVTDSVYRQPLHYNVFFKGGINQSDVIGSKQYPYYAVGGYVDKRISRKSGFQLGAEFFIPKYLKEYIHYKSVAFPEEHVDPDTDYHKAGIFGGYELYINRMSFEAQVGYYVYAPFKSTGMHYERIGLKYYFSKRIFGGLGLKTHGAKAEVLELGLGYRL